MDYSILEKYPNCIELLDTAFSSLSKTAAEFLKYGVKVPDVDFLDNLNINPDAKVYNPLKWYNSFNSEFKPLNEVNPKLEVYKPLLQQFIKDLYILMKTEQFPLLTKKDKDLIQKKREDEFQDAKKLAETIQYNTDFLKKVYPSKNISRLLNKEGGEGKKKTFYNTLPETNANTIPFMIYPKQKNYKTNNVNKYRTITFVYDEKKCNILLDKIEKTIEKGYLYLDVIECFKIYLEFMSFGEIITDGKRHYCTDELELIDKLLKTPFLIYPSFMVPNYYKILSLIGAPIINVWCMNKIGVVHNMFLRPCLQVFHDIDVHGKFTHQFHKYINPQQNEELKKQKNKELKDLFDTNTEILTKLLPSLQYNTTNPIIDEQSKEKFKKIIILFILLHEELLFNIKYDKTKFYNIIDILNFLFSKRDDQFEYNILIDNLINIFIEEYNKVDKNVIDKDEKLLEDINLKLADIYTQITKSQPAGQAGGGAKNNYRRKLSRKNKLTKMKKTIKTKSRK